MKSPWGVPSADDQPLPAKADIVIVGASLAGLAAARRLREGGASVVVLEAGETPGGAVAMSPGMAWLGLAEHPWRILDSLGEAKARELYDFCREGLATLGRSGGEWVPATEAEKEDIEKDIAALRRLGVPVEGSREGMVLSDETAVDPLSVIGSRATPIVTRARVTAVRDRTLETTRGPITGEILVFAASAPDPWFEGKVFPYREQALWGWVEKPPRKPLRTGHGYTSFGPGPHGSLVATGCRWATPHLEEGESTPKIVDIVQKRIEAAVTARYGPVNVEGRWSWIEHKSCDGLPLVGPIPGAQRIVVCTAFHGNALGMALRAGVGVADGILGRPSGLPALLSPARLY